MNINLKLDKINKSFQKSLLNQTDPEQMKVLFLGRKAELNEILKNIKTLPADERMSIGAKANLLKKEIETKIANFTSSKQEKSFYDLTLPAALNLTYSVHPLRQIQNEIVEIFTDLGFEVASGPEIESDWYNFEALNIHANHPARDDQDSFYINREQLLRTQTSPVQIRVLEKSKPPVRIICPGKTVIKPKPMDEITAPPGNFTLTLPSPVEGEVKKILVVSSQVGSPRSASVTSMACQ